MTDLAKMAAIVADRILELHEAGASIPPGQFRLLVRSAQMLLDSGVPWPQSVERVIMEIALRIEQIKPDAVDSAPRSRDDDVVVHLMDAISKAEWQREQPPGDPTGPVAS